MGVEDVDSRDQRIGAVVNDYLDRQQRGEPVDEQELIAAHPELAPELREHLMMVREVMPGLSRSTGSTTSAASLPHDSLPGYDILDEIHRGGQGVVYEAVQKATRRKVAIKVMREGPFAGWRDHARFEREVQVLGALRHTGIVTIHDSGAAAGCHYFVMDYIPGAPLNEWLDGRRREPEEVLRLFVAICDAVNAAHVKGIIHRDLKPGNIRVDEQGRPHVLDFGLAKLAAEDHPQQDMTAVGQFVGSLPWTSPEQAQGLVEQIDTRTDVYALGVMLYQMVTGRFPYEVAGPVRDVLNRIVNDEPVRPRAIHDDIARDVEAIVLKCLRKQPHRRYQSAGELGHDLERFLSGEAVTARGDSTLYVLGRVLRRHRVAVAVAASFALLITISLLASLSLWRQAVAQRDLAVVAQTQENLQRSRADAKAAEAEQARMLAESERARVQQQAEALRRTTYLNRIALAQVACEQKYLTQAQHLLANCPADLRGWEWHYLSRISRPPTLLDVGADSRCLLDLSISSDGRQIACSGCDGVIRIFDARTGARLRELWGHSGQVNTTACSPDGRWLASAGRDTTLRLWDLQSGAARVLDNPEGYVHCLAFSPDSRCLATGGQGRLLTFRNPQTGQTIRRSAVAHDNEVSCVAFSPDGEQLVSGEFLDPIKGQSRLRLWNAADGSLVKILATHPSSVLCTAFSPDGKQIAFGSGMQPTSRDAQGTLKVVDLTGAEILSLEGNDGFVEDLSFSPDGTLLASAGVPRSPAFGTQSDRTLKIWSTADGTQTCTYSAHQGGAKAVAWSADAARVYSCGMDGRLKAWPTSAPPEARILHSSSASVLRIAFSPDGSRLASTGGPTAAGQASGQTANGISIWNLQDPVSPQNLTGHDQTVVALAWSPDGQCIASGGADQQVRLWSSREGKQTRAVEAVAPVQAITFATDSSRFAYAAANVAVVCRAGDGVEIRRFYHAQVLRSLAFSHDGRWLITGTTEGEVRVLDIDSSVDIRTFTTAPGLNHMCVRPGSDTIATGHMNGTIYLWDISSGAHAGDMVGPQTSSVQWIDFSPDGERIASADSDMMLRIWDPRSQSEVYRLRAHDAPLLCVRFSPDGTAIATSSHDGLIKIWETQPRLAGSQSAALVPRTPEGDSTRR